jgi:GxxExxY protein
MMTENEISKIVVHSCFEIHKKLGPGLFESVYEEILFYELNKMGLEVKRQVVLPVKWEELTLDKGYIADLIVNDKLIIELKSVEKISTLHQKQLLSYLKLSGMKLGLLINFNVSLIKNGIQRIVNGL